MLVDDVLFIIEKPIYNTPNDFKNNLMDMKYYANKLGYDTLMLKKDILSYEIKIPPDINLNRPVVTYGSINFIKNIKNPIYPNHYGFSGTDWLSLITNIERKWFINSDFYITTWGEFKLNYNMWFGVINNTEMFIRPISDKKVFSGRTIKLENVNTEIITNDRFTMTNDNTLIVLSTVKNIKNELRCFIVGNEIITHSFYDNIEDTSVLNDLITYVKEFLRDNKYRPDSCFCIDVANYDDDIGIMEMNSFCSSGLYDSDVELLVDKVAKRAITDYKEIFDI